MFNLGLGAFVAGLIAQARRLHCPRAEKFHFALTGWQRVARKFVAKIRQLEAELRRHLSRVEDCFRKVGKKARHFNARLQMTFGIPCEKSSRFRECGFVMKASKHVEDLPLRRSHVANPIGCHQRQLQASCETDRLLIASFLIPFMMSLQLYVNIPAAKRADQAFEANSAFPLPQGDSKRAVAVAC